MALTVIQLNEKLDRLFDLRVSGNTLTGNEVKEVAFYRDLLNEYFAQRASGGITPDFLREFSVRFEEAETLYLATLSSGVRLGQVEVVDQKTLEKPALNETVIDPSNVNKTIRDIQTAGKDIEEGTKTQEFSKLEGTFNEFSNSALFIETIKTTIAQSVEPIPVAVNTPVPPTVNQDAGFTIASIETLKSDVSQILQTGEIQIVRTVELGTYKSAVYNDPESAVRATAIKQDSLDPTVSLIAEAVNPYNVTGAQLDILQNNLALEAESLVTQFEIAAEIQEFEQVQLAQEQSAAVESFTGGG
jgi:hypothetical protein